MSTQGNGVSSLKSAAWSAVWLPWFVVLVAVSSACESTSNAPGRETDPVRATDVDAAAGSQQSGSAIERWQVVLGVSGGIAGENYQLSIASLGDSTTLHYVDVAHGKSESRSLESQQAAELRQLVRAVPADIQGAQDEQCRDCFGYSLEIRRDAAVVNIRFDSVTLRGSAVESLTAKLLSLRSSVR